MNEDTMRIAIGGFMHETHSFAPRPTTFQDFLTPGGWPHLQRGAEMIDALHNTAAPISGAIRQAEARGVDLVPLLWCMANPAGPIDDEAFERICAMLVADLSDALRAGHLDGVYLDLHGAALADLAPDAEGELLRRVRAVIGAEMPLVISLDPHANLTETMMQHSDAVVPFRTYPHVDMREAGWRAMKLLIARIQRKAPFAKAFRALNFWMPLTSQCTLVNPMKAVMHAREQISIASGVTELAFCFGFPYADFPGCQATISAFAADQRAADLAADGLLAYLNQHESDFVLNVIPAADAVAAAKKIAERATRPVVLADTQDNPGGGGHGDTTGLLAELVRQHARGSVLASINDAASVAACQKAGVGGMLFLSLGGKSDDVPLDCQARVLKLTDGDFVCTGPMAAGNPAHLGPTALISVGQDVRVIVTSTKMQAYDQALLRHVGIEPATCKILALKSSVHFRADFQALAEKVMVVQAPGPVMADPSGLPFKHVRPDIRRLPRRKA